MALRAGMQLPAGPGWASVLPDIDFETYSEAGFIWSPEQCKWLAPRGATKKGLPSIGAAAYAQHPSTEVLSLYYDLKDGHGARMWRPGLPAPLDLIAHVADGGPIEAHNAQFELWIWNHVCTRRYGWPSLAVSQLNDSRAKAQAAALPPALGKLAEVLRVPTPKQADGKRLINRFSMPRNPTKKNPSLRVLPEDDPEDFARFQDYNRGDIVTEAEVSQQIADLPPVELAFYRRTVECNQRGVQLDMPAVRDCAAVLDAALERYGDEMRELTGGTVERGSQRDRLIGWLAGHGVHTRSLTAEAVDDLLPHTMPDPARRALEIRQRVGSASVKKLYAMLRQVTPDGRLHDLFNYHGARTGRDTGADVQPQNLPKAGPPIVQCGGCGRYVGKRHAAGPCPHCRTTLPGEDVATPWGWEATESALEVLATRSLDWVEHVFGDALLTISGCIRGLFVAGPGMELVSSDYSSIEAVVTAMLASEQWRIDAFARGEDIYLHGAAGVTGHTYDWYKQWAAGNGDKHPDRSAIGKPGELGLGFGGWINAWLQFDSSGRFTENQIRDNIIAWRDASPAIVELWGGQVRGKPWAPERHELYGLEGAAIAAVQNPGTAYQYRLLTYCTKGDALYCRLPSGRLLTYHRPRLSPSQRWPDQVSLSFEGWNTNPQSGPVGWIRMNTYGGRLTENVVQAVARDIMRDAVLRLESAGYPIVLRVHDELAAEVPAGSGDVATFEALMAKREGWYADWPIRCGGGWIGHRFRKD